MSDKKQNTANNRGNIRHLISVAIRLIDENGVEIITLSDNVSDCGLFVQIETGDFPVIGSIVQVQVMDTLGDGSEAPVNRAKVVRHDSRGVGLKFLFDD